MDTSELVTRPSWWRFPWNTVAEVILDHVWWHHLDGDPAVAAEATTQQHAAPRCQADRMAKRSMTDEHRAAIAAGQTETSAVKDYLEALEAQRPRPGRRVSAKTLQARRIAIDAQIAEGGLKTMKRLELLHGRRDIDAQIAALADEPDRRQPLGSGSAVSRSDRERSDPARIQSLMRREFHEW